MYKSTITKVISARPEQNEDGDWYDVPEVYVERRDFVEDRGPDEDPYTGWVAVTGYGQVECPDEEWAVRVCTAWITPGQTDEFFRLIGRVDYSTDEFEEEVSIFGESILAQLRAGTFNFDD